jgi:hypothetical protein
MIVAMIITLLLLFLLALFVLEHSVKTASVGYEDEFGFHEGSDPQGAPVFSSETSLETSGNGGRAPKAGSRTRRILKRAAMQSLGHAS